MVRTKEIRWFFKNDNEYIKKWFLSLPFNCHEKREDVYLNLKNENIGVKLREGAIEIKYRQGIPEQGYFQPDIEGYFENWTKWSFDTVTNHEKVGIDMVSSQKDWLTIKKNRLFVIVLYKDDKPVFHPPSNDVEGIQIEFTELMVNEREKWYTFSFECSVDTPLRLNRLLLKTILGDTKLSTMDSMGYAAFLDKSQS